MSAAAVESTCAVVAVVFAAVVVWMSFDGQSVSQSSSLVVVVIVVSVAVCIISRTRTGFVAFSSLFCGHQTVSLLASSSMSCSTNILLLELIAAYRILTLDLTIQSGTSKFTTVVATLPLATAATSLL